MLPKASLMHRLKYLYDILKGFLSEFSGKEFLIFLFCLAISGVFWLMMTLNETYEVEFPVPIRLVGVPKNVVMTSDMTDTVRVTIRDKGFTILAYDSYNKLRPIRLSFSKYANRQAGKGQVPPTDIQKIVKQRLYSSSVITAMKADKLYFTFNFGRNKRMKVSLSGNIVPGKNCYLAHIQITPDMVTVYASKELLSKTDGVSTEQLNISNFEDTVTRIVKIKEIEGAKISPSTVKVTLFPDVLTEGSQKVPIKTINKPSNLTIRTFPQNVTVKYSVGANVYRQVRPTDFEVFVDYKEIASQPSDKCRLYLRSHSRLARNARLENDKVDYLIEQQ